VSLPTGRITAHGSAKLQLDGIVNNESYAIDNAHRGKPCKYRVRARFEPAAGRGERLTGRAWHSTFSR